MRLSGEHFSFTNSFRDDVAELHHTDTLHSLQCIMLEYDLL